LVPERFRGRLSLVWAPPLLAGALLVAGARPAAAHAILVTSSLEGKPVTAETITAVTLRFNCAIEVSLSRALLLNAGSEASMLSVAPGPRPGEMVVQLPALAPGRYGVRYKVLAADGHLTDAILYFSVSAPR
jgi:copper resistance protein C